jgi:hypothetical protein
MHTARLQSFKSHSSIGNPRVAQRSIPDPARKLLTPTGTAQKQQHFHKRTKKRVKSTELQQRETLLLSRQHKSVGPSRIHANATIEQLILH